MKNSKKVKKINITNLLLLIVLAICLVIVVGDLVCVFINLFKSISFTSSGLITFIICAGVGSALWDYFFEDDDK